jgi:hypothetical protein
MKGAIYGIDSRGEWGTLLTMLTWSGAEIIIPDGLRGREGDPRVTVRG